MKVELWAPVRRSIHGGEEYPDMECAHLEEEGCRHKTEIYNNYRCPNHAAGHPVVAFSRFMVEEVERKRP